ncbi:MAG TPA: tRNA uridine-5-carboxymethylaminomethyl(34) synthesis GTPase MnmE, partial [Tepiditoga sp.]|nr:tRNA uridine-5-carboxymethylaminomethyl(34) synthesis GTPase MnmE [Tepiditoga sp.]
KKIYGKNNFKNNFIYYGWLKNKNNEIVDETMWVYYKNPKSYTGEDMLEIFCHGGILITEQVFSTVLLSGAREALPGEFSKRAVLNGKMSLIKAEAVNEIIKSSGKLSLKASLNQITGNLNSKINDIKNYLTEISAFIEVELDYPDDVQSDEDNILKKLYTIKNITYEMLKNADNGIKTVHGIKTSIIGKPNAGKSTLLNALLRKERAIVTDIPGTTRDTIEEDLNISGISLRIIDTAGIRETEDIIEKIGVERSKKAIEESDLIIFLIDNTTGITDEDKHLMDYIKRYPDKEVIYAVNKSDIITQKKYESTIETVFISSKNNEISELEKTIYNRLKKHIVTDNVSFTNIRQKTCAQRAYEHIENAIKSKESGYPNDIIMFDIRKALESVLELTGENYSDILLEKIFSDFCVGK